MLKIWEDHITRLEKILTAEGEKASSLLHSGMKGDVRENFVSKFLRDFLPESIGVGKGEVFDRDNRRSKQIDIILFDKSFPIATLEVKSELNSTHITEALDNCLALMKLRPRQFKLLPPNVCSPGYPSIQDFDFLYPSTYVVAYSGYKKNHMALAEAIVKWFKENINEVKHVPFPRLMLPRVVVTPTIVWFRKADNLKFNDETGPIERDFYSVASVRAFRVFVADLLNKILRRSTPLLVDFPSKTQWVSCATENFDIVSCLEENTDRTTGILFPEPDQIAEREFTPTIRTPSSGFSVESDIKDPTYKWVRYEGLLMGGFKKRTEDVEVEYLEQVDQEGKITCRKLGLIETEGQAAELLRAILPTNRYKFSKEGIPQELSGHPDHPDKRLVVHKDGNRLLGYYSRMENDNKFLVFGSLPNDQSNFRGIGAADSEEDAIMKILDYDGLRTGLFQFSIQPINTFDQ